MEVVAAEAQEEKAGGPWKTPRPALSSGKSREDPALLAGKSSKGVQTAAAAFLCDPAVFVSAATQTAPCSLVEVETSMAELKPTSDPGKAPQLPDNQVRGSRRLGGGGHSEATRFCLPACLATALREATSLGRGALSS